MTRSWPRGRTCFKGYLMGPPLEGFSLWFRNQLCLPWNCDICENYWCKRAFFYEGHHFLIISKFWKPLGSSVWYRYITVWLETVVSRTTKAEHRSQFAWWRHQMETFPRYWPFVRGIHRLPDFPAQRPVTRSFDVSFDLRLNKRLRKQSWGWWFETPSRSLWRRRNGTHQRNASRASYGPSIVNILHYNGLIMSVMASQITGASIVCSTVCSGADQEKLRATGLCEGNPPMTDGFPSQGASNAENVSIWRRHHGRK